MVLLRKVIGDVLRARRLAQRRTLREVSTAANVSLGYLSEIERGHKEASSELLASICDALGARLSEMLADVAVGVSLAEGIAELPLDAAIERLDAPPEEGLLAAPIERTDAPADGRQGADFRAEALVGEQPARGQVTRVTLGEVTVHVRSEGPLKTTLTAKRTAPPAPGQRPAEPAFAS